MKKIKEFLKDNGMLIILPLVLIIFFRTCSTKSDVDKIKKVVTEQSTAIDTLKTIVMALPNTIQLNDDEQTAKFLYWERQADAPAYKDYTIKDYYDAIKK